MPIRFLSTLVNNIISRSPSQDCAQPRTQSSSLSSSPSLPLSLPTLFSKKTDNTTYQPPPLTANDAVNWHEHQKELDRLQELTPLFEKEPFPKSLDQYNVKETLGTGTFGRVFLAKEAAQGRTVAIKVLKKADVVRLRQVEHINNERQVLASLHFPFIVQLFCTFQDTERLYMIQEFVLGGELFRHLRRAGRFSNNTAKFYAAEIVLALEYMHSKDIIYRDLKPENLLLDKEGHIKITDFGFAKIVTERTWTLCGTPEYLAPEIINSKGHGKAVDWWSLGILIYEMLAGFPPFYDDNHFGIYEKILECKLNLPNHLDASAKDLLKRLLVVDRTRRLGNLKGGPNDIKMHKWFRGTDWLGLLKRSARPPLVPSFANDEDTTNFDRYSMTNIQGSYDGKDPHKDLFPDF
ncbi:kinase-like domain-containing protein [Gongronella butleri]|nr:kinase-like domain-containing protein [Gongronella butleri]